MTPNDMVRIHYIDAEKQREFSLDTAPERLELRVRQMASQGHEVLKVRRNGVVTHDRAAVDAIVQSADA